MKLKPKELKLNFFWVKANKPFKQARKKKKKVLEEVKQERLDPG